MASARFFVLALLSTPALLQGQEAGSATTPRSVTLRPSDVVAERVRQVLYGDPSRESIRALAEVMPATSMGQTGDAEAPLTADAEVLLTADAQAPLTADGEAPLPAESERSVVAPLATPFEYRPRAQTDVRAAVELPVFEEAAVQLLPVEPLSDEPVLTLSADPVPTVSADPIPTLVDRLAAVNVESLFRLLAGLVVLVAMAVLLRGRGGGIRKRSGGATSGARPVVDARSLVANGVPLHEITRRTGLGRDALALLAQRRPS